MYWQCTLAPAGWRWRGTCWRGWHSLAARSLFLARMTEPSAVAEPIATEVSQENGSCIPSLLASVHECHEQASWLAVRQSIDETHRPWAQRPVSRDRPRCHGRLAGEAPSSPTLTSSGA